MGEKDGCEYTCKFSWSGKFYICQGEVREFRKPIAVTTMVEVCCFVYLQITGTVMRAAKRVQVNVALESVDTLK